MKIRGYESLTLYFAKSGLIDSGLSDAVRKVAEADVPAIVRPSAEHRQVLHDLDPFWEPHKDADERFGN